MSSWLKEPELINRWASFEGINTVNIVKTPQDVQQERQQPQQQAQQQAMMQSGAESMGQAGGQAIVNSMAGQQNQ